MDYRARFDVDVTTLAGAGAGGGLAGGLLALGATVTGGAAFVADQVGLADALMGASLVVTGEGAIDHGTLDGKVVAEVLSRSADVPALLVAGSVDDEVAVSLAATRRSPIVVTELVAGSESSTEDAISEAVAAFLASAAGSGQLEGV